MIRQDDVIWRRLVAVSFPLPPSSRLPVGKEDAQAGAGIFYGSEDGRNRAIELIPSNNVAEILGIKETEGYTAESYQ